MFLADSQSLGSQCGMESVQLWAAHAHRRLRRTIHELRDRRIRNQPTPTDHHQLLRRERHLRQEVTRHEHRAALGRQPLHELTNPDDALRIETVDRLVEQQHLRIPQQRTRQPQTLRHTEREPAGLLARHLGQSDQPEHLVDAGLRDPVRSSHPLQMRPRTAIGVHPLRIQQRTHRPQRRLELAVRLALDQRRTRRRLIQTQDHPHRRRLACTVRAQEARHDARLDRERQVVHRFRRSRKPWSIPSVQS